MGTNYYLNTPTKQLHIGKSSAGWCFTLHVSDPRYPDRDPGLPASLPEWKNLFFDPDTSIVNEYEDHITPKAMVNHITKRAFPRDCTPRLTPDELKHNSAIEGPNNLLRHTLDNRHCIGHGHGTWDLVTGEFS
jgi:hypothetical protein